MKLILSILAVSILLISCAQESEQPKQEGVTVQDMAVDSLVFKVDSAKVDSLKK